MKKKYFFILFLLMFTLPHFSLATKIVFTPSSPQVQLGDLVKVNMYLVQDSDSINAVEGKFVFSSDLLTVSNISFGNSVLNFWPEEPHVEKSGVISFSGVTPGGFGATNKALLFSVVFKAVATGTADLNVTNGSALKNDGTGSPSKLTIENSSLIINPKTTTAQSQNSDQISAELDLKNDTEAPESFTPMIGKNTDTFGGKYFVVFETNDKQSGIDHYEIQESKNNSPKYSGWIKTTSPYVLSDQTLHSFVFVKATDKAGNTRIEKISPLYPQKFYQSIFFWIIILLLCVIIFLVSWRRR